MNPGLWIFVIATGIIIAFAVLIFVFPSLFKFGLVVAKKVRHLKYVREARKHNARARELRLQRTEWYGLPLPMGKEGTLRITYEDLIANPHRISSSQMNRAYRDRGLDLKVDLEVENDPVTGDYVVKWYPHKGRWPRERY